MLLPRKLSQIHKVDEIKLKKVILDETAGIRINQKILSFVKNFKGRKILFSYGDNKFQRLKIKNLDLEEYFDRVFITKNKKIDSVESLTDGYSDITIIDNNQQFLSKVNLSYPTIKTFTPAQISYLSR